LLPALPTGTSDSASCLTVCVLKHVSPAFTFLLTQVGIIIAVVMLALLLVLPASLGPSTDPNFGSEIRGERWLMPAVLFTDLLLGLLGTLNIMCALSKDSKLKRLQTSFK
jgi:hypothetical protein